MVIFGPNTFAHTAPGNRAGWETLDEHSANVAKLAEQFAAAFDAGDWGSLLGWWHDLGKASAAFQSYLGRSDPDACEETPGRVDHSTFGARYAARQFRNLYGQVLAFCIAGHHAGLADATSTDAETLSALKCRLDAAVRKIEPVTVPANLPAAPPSLVFPFKLSKGDPAGFAVAFFTRMLFSALVDADRIATERFCNPAQADSRAVPKPSLEAMRCRLDAYLSELQQSKLNASRDPTPVNAVRAAVLKQCLSGAELPKGFFSLDVPTGGGKTFASLAFALHHARAHPDLRRAIVAIPFTSIIEQTADQYRKALGALAQGGLVEHHSNLNPKNDTTINKLATENWDAPLIVTTNVQLFESVFASATTPARKLHRLPHSVIVLDEAQTIPVNLLEPTLLALKELVARYGCSVVLCTATQPALEFRSNEFTIGLEDVRPIIQDVSSLHRQLKRVDVSRIGIVADVELAARMAGDPAALCIVNTKAHASRLYDELTRQRGAVDGCFHLSTLMCAQHRRDVLEQIRLRLAEKRGCWIVSTQLIEAGVDLDLPVVYRAASGFDSIAQAAGRCNREGLLVDANGSPIRGQVFVFDTNEPPAPGLLRQSAQVARELSSTHPDPLQPSAIEAYFRLLYWTRSSDWDRHHVNDCFQYNPYDKNQAAFAPLQFKTAARSYRIIPDDQTPILVPYDETAQKMRDHLCAGKPIDFQFFRDAQRYMVSVYERMLMRLEGNKVLVPHEAGIYALVNEDAYSNRKGLLPDVAGVSPEILMA